MIEERYGEKWRLEATQNTPAVLVDVIRDQGLERERLRALIAKLATELDKVHMAEIRNRVSWPTLRHHEAQLAQHQREVPDCRICDLTSLAKDIGNGSSFE